MNKTIREVLETPVVEECAAIAAARGLRPRDIPVPAIQAELRRQGAEP